MQKDNECWVGYWVSVVRQCPWGDVNHEECIGGSSAPQQTPPRSRSSEADGKNHWWDQRWYVSESLQVPFITKTAGSVNLLVCKTILNSTIIIVRILCRLLGQYCILLCTHILCHHWAKIPKRIHFKFMSLTYNYLQHPQSSIFHREPLAIQPTRSARLSSCLSLSRPQITSHRIFSNRSCERMF